jgi:hypothetical protein
MNITGTKIFVYHIKNPPCYKKYNQYNKICKNKIKQYDTHFMISAVAYARPGLGGGVQEIIKVCSL